MTFKTILKLTFYALLMLGLSQVAVAAKGKDAHAGRLNVMTQNLYVGADLFKVLSGELEDVPFNVAEIFGNIQATDFQQRADAIADLVLEHEPHLIGLQEVSLIRTQCPYDPTTDATDVYADYLQILLDALAARGLSYEVAAIVEDADVEMPAANLGLLDCPDPLFDVRLTDHDVTLRRSDVEVTLSMSANYQANFPVPTPAGPIVFKRGYNIVDADIQGRSYRFVNTHLEVNGNPFAHFFQSAQAYELTQILNGMAGTFGDEILVVVGDLNSDPREGPLVECMLPPTFDTLGLCPTPYALMMADSYTDTWKIKNGVPGPGYTCCQSELLTNFESMLDQRYDQVFVRPPLSGAQGPHFIRGVHAEVLGLRLEDRSVDGLWPSDHAGVIVGMTLRQEK